MGGFFFISKTWAHDYVSKPSVTAIPSPASQTNLSFYDLGIGLLDWSAKRKNDLCMYVCTYVHMYVFMY